MPRAPIRMVSEKVDGYAFIRYFTEPVRKMIPKPIEELLDLKPNDIIEIIVRKVDDKYSLDAYGRLPNTRGRFVACPWLHVKCPVCGEEGTIQGRLKDNKYPFILVVHYTGATTKTYHYIDREKYKDFFAKAVKLVALCREATNNPRAEIWKKIAESLK